MFQEHKRYCDKSTINKIKRDIYFYCHPFPLRTGGCYNAHLQLFPQKKLLKIIFVDKRLVSELTNENLAKTQKRHKQKSQKRTRVTTRPLVRSIKISTSCSLKKLRKEEGRSLFSETFMGGEGKGMNETGGKGKLFVP